MTAVESPIPADVRDRILARIEAAIFELPAPTLAVVRQHTHTCQWCGTGVVFNGTDGQWAVRRTTFAETHDCGDDA